MVEFPPNMSLFPSNFADLLIQKKLKKKFKNYIFHHLVLFHGHESHGIESVNNKNTLKQIHATLLTAIEPHGS